MNKTILSKDVKVEGNKVVITENTETRLDRNNLEVKLRDLQMQKMRLKEQNVRLVDEYNLVVLEETEISDLISKLSTNEGIEEI
ncbi:MAG TPA: hypothetical protein GX707_07840 [Epulopiscium sp.]|nr:hypothetical protein [Candidatus Epulonipiscium sp.]